MPVRLGELLVAEKMISTKQLEDAVEAQCLYGGRLGTSLIELGYLGEEEIAVTLSRKLHLPYMASDLLMQIPAEVIALVPQRLAWKHLVIPCRLEKKRLYLALSDPTNLTIIDALAFRLGFIIVPVVVPELRLMLALQLYYQFELSPRFRSLQQREQRLDQNSLASLAQPVQKGQQPLRSTTIGANRPLLGTEESPAPLSDAEYRERINMPRQLRQHPGEDKGGADRHVTLEVSRLHSREQHPFRLFCKQLTGAQTRDDIADAIIERLAPLCSGVALLMIKEGFGAGEATGWRAAVAGEALAGFAQLHIPLDQPSVLQTVARSRACYLGPLPQLPNNLELCAYFGPQPPKTVLLIPLLLRERLVTLLYLQNDGENVQHHLIESQRLINKAALAFEMLILKNKIQMG